MQINSSLVRPIGFVLISKVGEQFDLTFRRSFVMFGGGYLCYSYDCGSNKTTYNTLPSIASKITTIRGTSKWLVK
jgi:hypothetical protein